MQKNKTIRILGVDPGFGRIGFGVVDSTGGELVPVSCGCIETSAKKAL